MALTDEDKQWLTQHFATKADLERFATKIDLERFATNSDLERFATRADLEHISTKEGLEAVETKLLSAFHSWASPVEARQRGQRDILHALDLQVSSLEERVKRLESGSPAK